MSTVIHCYLGSFIGLLFLFTLIKLNHLFSKKQNDLFVLATIVNIILIFTTSIDLLISDLSTDYLWIFRRVTSFLNFAGGPIIPLILLIIFKQNKTSFLLYIPLIINAIICFISMFVNVVFMIAMDNGYHRGPLFFVPLVTTFFYLGLMLIKPDDFQRHGRRAERLFVLAIICITILGNILEIKFYYLLINYSCSAICLIGFYIIKNIHYFMIDPLTGAYNRQMYQHVLAQINRTSTCYIVLLDINSFKSINDNYGHEEGDKALILFVKILHKYVNDKSTLYRIGGDEFAIISKKNDFNSLCRSLDEAELEAEKNNISFAYGIVKYQVSGDIHDALRDADKSMYEKKVLMKQDSKVVSSEITNAHY